MTVTNTQTYYGMQLIFTVKSFVAQAPGEKEKTCQLISIIFVEIGEWGGGGRGISGGGAAV
jgi:hypothetical protein